MVSMFQNVFFYSLLTVLCSGNRIPFAHETPVLGNIPKHSQPDGRTFGNRPIAQRLSGETEDVSFEDSVIRSMLQIVDIKFDTLSTRLLSLERGINNMQFYLSRQFNQVTKNLQAVNMVMNSLHGEVSHVDIETRTVKNSIHALSKEFLEYRNRNTGIFGELPSHPVISEIVDDLQRKPPEIIHGNFLDKTHTSFHDKVDLAGIEEVLDNQSYPLSINHLQTYIEKGFKALDDSIKTHISNSLMNISTENQKNLTPANFTADYLNRNSIKPDAYKEINDRLRKLEASIDKSDNDHNTLVSRVKFVNDHSKDSIITGPSSTDSPRHSKRSETVDFKEEFLSIDEKLQILSAKQDEFGDYFSSTQNSLEVSKNNSEKVVKLVEALSSSTIWIPHILHEISTWSKLFNQSLSFTYMLYKEIVDYKSDFTSAEKSNGTVKSALSKLFDKKSTKSSAYDRRDLQQNPVKCEFNEKDLKKMQQQLSQMEELLETHLKQKPSNKPKTKALSKGG